ncbi:monovalent cation:H+ antiporter-2, CPA2 family, partial [Candidatus Methanophagaceae archaeon]
MKPMTLTISPYILLLTIALFAFIIPLISGRIGVPAVVGEIIFGIFLGVLGLSLDTEGLIVIDFLAGFGLIFLMFLAGLEIDFSKVEIYGVKPFLLGICIFIFTFGLSVFLTSKLGYGLYLAILLSTSAVGLVVPTIRELGLLKTDFGQTTLI